MKTLTKTLNEILKDREWEKIPNLRGCIVDLKRLIEEFDTTCESESVDFVAAFLIYIKKRIYDLMFHIDECCTIESLRIIRKSVSRCVEETPSSKIEEDLLGEMTMLCNLMVLLIKEMIPACHRKLCQTVEDKICFADKSSERCTMLRISNKDLLLMLLEIYPAQGMSKGISQITRVQQFMFLLKKEYHISLLENGKEFEFTPSTIGPYSIQLDDSLELLKNLGYIKSEPIYDAIEEESLDVKERCFEDTICDAIEEKNEKTNKYCGGLGANDVCLGHRFYLTDEGQKRLCSLISFEKYEFIAHSIRKLKEKYSGYSLFDLLYYVFTEYPEMVIESKIKDMILKRDW